MSAKRVTLCLAAVVLVGAGLLPLCVMFIASLSNLRNYTETLGNVRTWALFGNSLLLATCTTAATAMIGVPLGVLFSRTDLPFRTILAGVLAVPILFPSYILAVGWFEVLGRGGLLAVWGYPLTAEVLSRRLFDWPGVVLVLSTTFLPVVMLLTMTSLQSISPSLEEAARISRGWPAVLKEITLPLISPGILLSLVLVFLLTMGEFGAPTFLRFDVFPAACFTQFAAFYNFGAATAAAMPILLVALLGLWLEQRVLPARSYQFRWGSRSKDASQISLQRTKWILFLLVSALALFSVGAPLAALLWRGLSPGALDDAITRAGTSALRSIGYASVSASLLVMIGFFLAYLVHRQALWGWRWLDVLTLFLFTLPGTVMGIGLVITWNRSYTNWIYATPAMLVIGYLAQYAWIASRTIWVGFSQLSPGMEEAAEVAGAGWFSRIFRILVPLLWPALRTSWAVAFLFCLRDTSLPLLLAPPGGDTLTARTWTLMANGSQELLAALCLLSISLACIPFTLNGVMRFYWRQRL